MKFPFNSFAVFNSLIFACSFSDPITVTAFNPMIKPSSVSPPPPPFLMLVCKNSCHFMSFRTMKI